MHHIELHILPPSVGGFPQSEINGSCDKRKAGSLTLQVPYSAFAPIVEGLL